jgi:hypothetical protein
VGRDQTGQLTLGEVLNTYPRNRSQNTTLIEDDDEDEDEDD